MAQRALERAARSGGEVHSSTLRAASAASSGSSDGSRLDHELGLGDDSPTAPMNRGRRPLIERLEALPALRGSGQGLSLAA